MTTEKPIQPSTDFSALIQAIRNTDSQDAVAPGKSSTSNSADTVCIIVYSTG